MTNTMPISRKLIDAACELVEKHTSWPKVDSALTHLRTRAPGFSPEATLLKVTAVNALYSTNIYDVVRVSDYFCSVMSNPETDQSQPQLVQTLAKVPTREEDQRNLRPLSLASKFAHFFVDKQAFPIYDRYARAMVAKYSGVEECTLVKDYKAFAKAFNELAARCEVNHEPRRLDRFLWVQGQYERWLEDTSQTNKKLRDLFEANKWPSI